MWTSFVPESDPECDFNMTESQNSSATPAEGHVWMWCSIGFRGNWAPVMEWMEDGKVVSQGAETSIVPNQSVASVLKTTHRNDLEYVCRTYFREEALVRPHSAGNVPQYTHTWKTTPTSSPGWAVIPVVICDCNRSLAQLPMEYH